MRGWILLAAVATCLLSVGACKKASSPVETEPNTTIVSKYVPPPPVKRSLSPKARARLTALGYVSGGETVGFNTESYDSIDENIFRSVEQAPLSTFSVDVDTASYSNVRRFLADAELPPADAVRLEELINYFHYDDPLPETEHPFGVGVEIVEAPWEPNHRLARIGIRGMEIAAGERPPANLVFLLDVSGSMNSTKKLPLVKRSMIELTRNLDGDDRVAIVVYAGAAGVVLPSTSDVGAIQEALHQLSAGGSTSGSAGIKLAYRLARESFIEGGTNRVVLATDGDFNVGITNEGDLVKLIRSEAESGVFLTVLGFGMGNYKDSTLEKLADKGNGNYAYIDTIAEARKVLVEGLASTLVTVAKDVKLQVEFNPAEVSSYRLIGYENRLLDNEDFEDDLEDAGDIGAGHTVTALYELVPVDGAGASAAIPLKYQTGRGRTEAAGEGEAFTLKIRYKEPQGKVSKLMTLPVRDTGDLLAESSNDMRFASAVAGFGMLLRESDHAGDLSLDEVRELALSGIGVDRGGYRAGFLQMIEQARPLMAERTASAPR